MCTFRSCGPQTQQTLASPINSPFRAQNRQIQARWPGDSPSWAQNCHVQAVVLVLRICGPEIAMSRPLFWCFASAGPKPPYLGPLARRFVSAGSKLPNPGPLARRFASAGPKPPNSGPLASRFASPGPELPNPGPGRAGGGGALGSCLF